MIKKCLFPAAGYGTRFLPATKAMPKEMLPVLTKPLIQYGVEEAVEAGMHTMAIVTGRGKRALEDHFDVSYELEHQIAGTDKEHYLTEIRALIDQCTFSYTRQNEMKGLGHAILTGETLIGNEPFAVILADDLCDGNGEGGVLSQMAKLYQRYRCSIVAIEEIDPSQTNRYGIIEGEEIEDGVYRITNMVEKPDPSVAEQSGVIGRHLTPEFFIIKALLGQGRVRSPTRYDAERDRAGVKFQETVRRKRGGSSRRRTISTKNKIATLPVIGE